MARIPDAFFDAGMGQNRTQISTYIPTGPSPGEIIARGAGNLANAAAGIVINAKQRADARDEESRRELDHRQQQEKAAEAKLSLITHADVLTNVAGTIAADTTMDAETKRQQFDEQSQTVSSQFFASLDPETRTALTPTFEEHRLSAKNHLYKILSDESRDQTRALTLAAAEAITSSARPLAEKLTLLHSADLFAGSGFTPDDQQRFRDQLIDRATVAEIDGRLNREDPTAIKKALSAKDGSEYSAYPWLDPVKRQSYIRTADNLIEQRQREAENQQKQAVMIKKAEAKDAFEMYRTARESLLPIDPKLESRLWQRMAGSEYEGLATGIKEKTGSLAFVQEKINSDPLTAGAARLGLMVPPLSLENPQLWPQQFAQRQTIGQVIKQEYGLPYTPILKADEAKALGRTLGQQPPEALMNVAQGLKTTGGLKPIAGQIAQEDRSLATVLALADQNPAGAYLVAKGRTLVQGGTKPDKLVTKSLDAAWTEQTKGSLIGMEKMKADLKEAVDLAYLAQASGQGKSEFDAALYRETMQSVSGAPVKINHKAVFMPMGMDEQTFKDGLKGAASLTSLQNAGGVAGFDTLMTAQEAILDDGRLHETEQDGVYLVELNGEMLMTDDDPTKPLRLTIGGVR